MKPRRTIQSTRVFRLAGGNEDNDLWVVDSEDEEGNSVIGSVWEPTEQERRQIAEGHNIILWVWGSGHPPVAIATTLQLGRP